MKATLENNGTELVLRLPIDKNPQLSSTGKSLILFSTHGFVKPVELKWNGRRVSLGINVLASTKTAEPGGYDAGQ